jgi:hypothetical protein
MEGVCVMMTDADRERMKDTVRRGLFDRAVVLLRAHDLNPALTLPDFAEDCQTIFGDKLYPEDTRTLLAYLEGVGGDIRRATTN